MVEEQTNKPQQGTYENLKTGEVDLKPKVEFEIGIGKEVEVVFDSDFEKPIEYPSKDDNGVFYVFNVKQNNEEKVIITSAWSLLTGFKRNEPLAGKTLKIKKEMVEGKQHYNVENPNEIKEEKVE